MRILKFGGKSLETKEKFAKVCEFIKEIYQSEKQIIVIVSAISNTTDNLINLSKEYGNNKNSNRELAILLSTGETQSASLFAMHLNSIGVPAKSISGKDICLHTLGDYTNSIITSIDKTSLLKCLNNNVVAVIAGFQGINSENEITTLGRGGSDTSAIAIATAFHADAEIYSDFDGVFAGDPRKDNYKKLNYVSYDFMIDMAKGGAKVLDERALNIAKNKNVTIISKSSSEPNSSGTIVSNIESNIIAINSQTDLCKITINFSNVSNINKIYKDVLLCLNNFCFYNLIINKNNISFLVNKNDYEIILKNLSKKMDLLNV